MNKSPFSYILSKGQACDKIIVVLYLGDNDISDNPGWIKLLRLINFDSD